MESINASFLPTRSSRGFMWALALTVGLACGLVCSAYHVCLEYALEKVWFDLGPEAAENLFSETPWLYICFVCTALGALTGLLLHVLGEPLANLPGVVQAFHRDGGQLDAREIPSTAVISVCGIVAGGSLGPEAPLVAIGGGLATFIGDKAGLDRADAHVLTICGMAGGLAAFFGVPLGGAIFACEVLHRNGLEYHEALVPATISGIACNLVFRVLCSLPETAIWKFAGNAVASPIPQWATILGVPLGLLGALIGLGWMKCVNKFRAVVLERGGYGKWHVAKGLVGGCVIGIIGAALPETLFWGEEEAQTLIDAGTTPLPHVWPAIGALGKYPLTPRMLILVGCAKLVAIGVTVLAGYRGGFIFPFMVSGVAIGCGFARAGADAGLLRGAVAEPLCALCLAAGINTCVTRTVLATPIVLVSISDRVDALPVALVASIVALHVTQDESVIKAARTRDSFEDLAGLAEPAKQPLFKRPPADKQDGVSLPPMSSDEPVGFNLDEESKEAHGPPQAEGLRV